MGCATTIRNERRDLRKTTPRVLIKTVADTGTPERLTALPSISSIVQSGRNIVFNFGSTVYAAVNDHLVASGFSDNRFNTALPVVAATANSITVDPSANATQNGLGDSYNLGGTVTGYLSVEFQSATFLGRRAARTDNTSDAYYGHASGNDTQTMLLPFGGERVVEKVLGTKGDLADYWLDVGTNGDGVVVYFE